MPYSKVWHKGIRVQLRQAWLAGSRPHYNHMLQVYGHTGIWMYGHMAYGPDPAHVVQFLAP
jgi:hypothetical protein